MKTSNILLQAGLPWSRSSFLSHYTKVWDTYVAAKTAKSASRKEPAVTQLHDFESFFDEVNMFTFILCMLLTSP